MAEGNEFPGPLRPLNRRDPSNGQNIPFGRTPLHHQGQSLRRELNEPLRNGHTITHGAATHIHHVGLPAGIEVTQTRRSGTHRESIARTITMHPARSESKT